MKNILFITALLLGNQVAFGMDIQHLEIYNLSYQKFNDHKSYSAVLKNNDLITAVFFTAGPSQGSFECTRRHTNENGSSSYIYLDKSIYTQLHNLYKAKKYLR